MLARDVCASHQSLMDRSDGACLAEKDADRLLELVEEALSLASQNGDIETEALCINERALLQRDANRIGEAIHTVSGWVARLGRWRPRISALGKLGKTLGSMRRLPMSATDRSMLNRVLDDVDRWKSS